MHRYRRWRPVVGSFLGGAYAGFYELLGRFYEQDVEALKRLEALVDELVPSLQQSFLEAAFGPSRLEQAIQSGEIKIVGIDIASGPERVVTTRREAGTFTIVDEIVRDFPPTPEEREKVRAWCTAQLQSRKQEQ